MLSEFYGLEKSGTTEEYYANLNKQESVSCP